MSRLSGRPSRPRRAPLGWPSPSPASTTSTTRWRPSSAALRLGVPLADIKRGIEGMEAVFGRVETIEVEGTPVSILLIKNPAGANEVLRTLRARAGAPRRRRNRPLDRTQRPHRRRPRRLLDLGRRLRAPRRAVRRVVCAGTRAPEMALRLKYAGLDREPARGRAGRRDFARARARRAPTAASSPSPPTPRCSSCAVCLPGAGSRVSTGSEHRPGSRWRRWSREAVVWHDLEHGA